MDWLSRLFGRFRAPSCPDRASTTLGRVASPAEFKPGDPDLVVRRVAPRYPRRAPAHRPPTKPSRISWCEVCDHDRRFCVHAWEDRRAKELVYATRHADTFHSRIDCHELTARHTTISETGTGYPHLSPITRRDARSQGLDPCRICLESAPVTRRR